MHPAIVRLLPVFLVLAAGVAAAAFWRSPDAAPTAAAKSPAAPVRTVRAQLNTAPELIRAVGQVRSQHQVVIRPQIDGLLVELRVREGQKVRQGELLARIDDRAIVAALDQAQAQLAMSRAQLHSAQQDLQRYRTLQLQQAVSVQLMEQQTAKVAEMEAAVRAQEATVAAQQVRLSYTRLYAPTDGHVGMREVDEGNFVTAASAVGLFTVTRLNPISVEIALPQAMLPALQTLLAARTPAPVRAYAGDGGLMLGQGQLVALDNRVARETGTVRIKADFDNRDERLWPGQSVTVTVEAGTQPNALSVPQNAVQQGLDGPFVYRVRDDRAEVVPVILSYLGDGVAVITGIEAGDEVVTDGQSRLRHGSAVQRSGAGTVARSNTP